MVSRTFLVFGFLLVTTLLLSPEVEARKLAKQPSVKENELADSDHPGASNCWFECCSTGDAPWVCPCC